MTAIFQEPWGTTFGYKCYICYSTYENGVSNHQSAAYLQKVMDSCAENFFSEITGDEFDWHTVILNEVLPFCQNCWSSIEKIYEMNNQKETEELMIDEIVQNLSSKVLSTRKYVKKKVVVKSTSPSQSSIGDGIKIEGFSVNRDIKCKMCHIVYTPEDPINLISLDISGKVMEICELHLYPELIDEAFYDWNSIPFCNFIPFCTECSQEMKRLVEISDKIEEIVTFISDHVDAFTLRVLKCRKALRKMGKGYKPGFGDDRSVTDSIESMGSQDTICFEDDDDDCVFLGVSNPTTGIYPSRFTETNLQEPSRPFAYLESIPTDYKEDFQANDSNDPSLPESSVNSTYQFQNDITRRCSAETCVAVADKIANSTRHELHNEEGKVPERNSSEPDSSSSRNDNMTRGNNLNLCRSSSQNGSGKIFKCHNENCGKMFIFKKYWEAHTAECYPKSFESSPILSCCDVSFAEEKSWREHLTLHAQQSETRSRSKSLPRQAKSTSTCKPVEDGPVLIYRCEFCSKRCGTEKGLKVHMYTHTRAHKCRKCRRRFRYLKHLKAHYSKEHDDENSLSSLTSASKSYSKLNGKTFIRYPGAVKFKIFFSCSFCKIPIENRRDLIDHVQTHYSIAEDKRCEICKTVFSRKQSLRKHNRVLHKFSN